jgi:hypothetical protein
VSVGKRLRFEVLKRDGFRCHYCGATPVGALLQVDHVIPRAEGGTDDPANLITACTPCNSGKSSVSLDESRLPAGPDADSLRERSEQVRSYLAALEEFEAAREEVRDFFTEQWRERVGSDPLMTLHKRWDSIDMEHGSERIMAAMNAVAIGNIARRSASAEARYFYACLRNMRTAAAPPESRGTPPPGSYGVGGSR